MGSGSCAEDVDVLWRQGPTTLSDVGLMTGMRNERELWDGEERWSCWSSWVVVMMCSGDILGQKQRNSRVVGYVVVVAVAVVIKLTCG